MTTASLNRRAFNPSLSVSASAVRVTGLGPDPIELMARADRADWALLRLVLCAATAIFVLALACSLPV